MVNHVLDFSDLIYTARNSSTVADMGNSTLSATSSSGVYLEVKEKALYALIIVSPTFLVMYSCISSSHTLFIRSIYSAAPQLHLPSEDGQNIGGLQSGETEDVAWT